MGQFRVVLVRLDDRPTLIAYVGDIDRTIPQMVPAPNILVVQARRTVLALGNILQGGDIAL